MFSKLIGIKIKENSPQRHKDYAAIAIQSGITPTAQRVPPSQLQRVWNPCSPAQKSVLL